MEAEGASGGLIIIWKPQYVLVEYKLESPLASL